MIHQQPQSSFIEYSRRTWVKPAIPTMTQDYMPLSDWDVVMFKSYTPILLFYTNPEKKPDFMSTEKLIDALSTILVDFCPLAGRLVDAGNGRDAIELNDEGVLFQEATYHAELERFQDQGYLPSQMDYHRMFPIHFYTRPADPLVAIQVTRFANDSGVALGIMMLHKIADKYSGCLFMDAWAKQARGQEYTKATFDRNLLFIPQSTSVTDEVLDHYRSEHRITHTRLSMDPDQPKYARTAPNGPKPLKSVVLEFYADGLQRCKRDAHTAEMIQHQNWVSTKDALLAMLFRAMVRSRDIPDNVEVKMVLGVNGRSKVKHMDFYFGNWILNRALTTTKQLARRTTDLSTLALHLRHHMGSLDISLFHGISKLYTIHEDMTVHYLSYQPNSPTHITASDVSNLPYLKLDFGDSKPDRVRGYITAGGDGCLVLFGRSDQAKGPMYDVQVQMDVDSMGRFVQDDDIKKYAQRILC